uniref:Lysosomal Pro-X carboxypeptidase n=1 Tax=Ditylenchus dipsaci TaxID=166011 RepID=A0A915EEX1_9BILA
MLTAWMRIKYPHIIDGGIAASAPVFWFRNANIPKGVSASFDAIVNLAKTEKGRAFLNQVFHLKSESQLQSPSDGPLLVGALQGIMETLAMVDYPYPANFLSPLPAWPIKEVCKAFTSKEKKSDEEYAKTAYHIANVFYNSTGDLSDLCLIKHCADSFAALGDPLGWPWQSCTEMVMPICSEGAPNDVFPKTCPFTDANAQAYCNATFGHIGYNPQVFRPQWAIDNYGASFPTASNIVFSNGYLDPWSGGGWDLKPATKGSLVSLIVEDGAHHLDLRGADPADTKSVLEVRRLEKLHIARWIKEANERHHQEKKNLKQRLAFPNPNCIKIGLFI